MVHRRLSVGSFSPGGVLAILVACACLVAGCASEPSSPVETGAEVLAQRNFESLSGQRVGLIVNHTARVDTAHLIDVIDRSARVELGAIFAPEHGLRGKAGAGEVVEQGRDPRTETPIYSLYGENRRPTPEMLSDLDALVFDIQDVGARFYTFITTMGLSMQSAAAADVPFIVLDRPNPLGGHYVSGFVLEPALQSFVGRYPIPIAHGMTVGELAHFLKGEAVLPGLDSLDLSVHAMKGWTRNMQWPDTGRDWNAPSPNLPTWQTALVYPGMALFEGVNVNEGRGTDHPFQTIGFPWPQDAVSTLVDTLQARSLPGIELDTIVYTPRARRGAPSPRYEDEQLSGLRLRITDRTRVRPVELGIHVLQAAYQRAQERGISDFISRPEHVGRLAGTRQLHSQLKAGVRPDSVIASWHAEVDRFRTRRRPYLLY